MSTISASNIDRVGGKGASLGELIEAGITSVSPNANADAVRDIREAKRVEQKLSLDTVR